MFKGGRHCGPGKSRHQLHDCQKLAQEAESLMVATNEGCTKPQNHANLHQPEAPCCWHPLSASLPSFLTVVVVGCKICVQ
jgi:hypothetical protein